MKAIVKINDEEREYFQFFLSKVNINQEHLLSTSELLKRALLYLLINSNSTLLNSNIKVFCFSTLIDSPVDNADTVMLKSIAVETDYSYYMIDSTDFEVLDCSSPMQINLQNFKRFCMARINIMTAKLSEVELKYSPIFVTKLQFDSMLELCDQKQEESKSIINSLCKSQNGWFLLELEIN